VKRLSPVITVAEADAMSCAAGSNAWSLKREHAISVGVIERGEHARFVIHT
jgi:hypothetical protein